MFEYRKQNKAHVHDNLKCDYTSTRAYQAAEEAGELPNQVKGHVSSRGAKR